MYGYFPLAVLPQAKRRVALSIAPEWIADTAPPLLLADAIPRLPEPRRAAFMRLDQRADALGLALRVYGSVAWEALTGRSYLTRESDVDLLWQATTAKQLAAAIAMFAAWEVESGIRADGEILFGDDDAVAWREWMSRGRRWENASARVLVKSVCGPRLEAGAKLLAALRECEMASCD